ncbi:MAG: hypothetical protein M1832_005947 [Thelocarpon impressellum]|nr:MAG: hypothetical protein M1832_005947 [Thelocarpon impressellum]
MQLTQVPPRKGEGGKTYSRQPRRVVVEDVDGPAVKRRRIGADGESGRATGLKENVSSSSSPPRADHSTLSSDPPSDGCDSPNTSPPSCAESPRTGHYRSKCSLPKRRLQRSSRAYVGAGHTPLRDISNVADRTPAPSTRPKRLTQMKIDLGQDVRKTCPTCGMEHTPSNAEDVALHKSYHKMNVGGVDLGKSLARSLESGKVWSADATVASSLSCFVGVVDRRSSLAERNKARQVLDVANTEMAAVEIRGATARWSPASGARDQASGPHGEPTPAAEEPDRDEADRSKTYLYVRGDKCVGLCLAEKITGAYRVLETTARGERSTASQEIASRSSSVAIGAERQASLLGISRIWTSHAHRRQGIALTLLECARTDFVYGMTLPKSMVAFSQPTESGGLLARRWFGESQGGWRVYVDN